jgi:gamma-glutamyltranspeptidase/glutathione hydrolase
MKSTQQSLPAPAVLSWLGTLLMLVLAFGEMAWGEESVTGKQGIAATIHPIASTAAIQAMREGGNAIDAAVSAALTLGVVDSHNSGIGGGCFMLIRLADHSIVAFDGREQAPAAATRDMFIKDGRAQPNLAQTGALAAGIPGSLAVYDHVLRHYGKLPLARHLQKAAEIGQDGFAINRTFAQRLAATADELKLFPASKKILLNSQENPFSTGDILVQTDLAGTYRAIATNGLDWFYRGDFARKTEQWMAAHHGLITAADFANYKMKARQPILTTYRGYQILGFPPPSSGGVHVAQILNILEQFNLHRMGPGSADFIHVVTEAMKLAFADRAFWLGDPAFAPVPKSLVEKPYGRRLAARIDVNRALPVPEHDTPEDATEHLFEKHTTHFSTADGEGNWVACTATINTSFGSKVIVPGTGVLLNNQMDDFAIEPGVNNYFGLVGGEANAIAPGKRPLSSMSPTLVLKDGRPVLCLGAAGGPTIISQTLLTILYVVDFGLPLSEALAQTRFHHQWQPDELRIERTVTPRVRRELERRGHRLKLVDAIGATQAVGFGTARKVFIGAADPRSEGTAAGY